MSTVNTAISNYWPGMHITSFLFYVYANQCELGLWRCETFLFLVSCVSIPLQNRPLHLQMYDTCMEILLAIYFQDPLCSTKIVQIMQITVQHICQSRYLSECIILASNI